MNEQELKIYFRDSLRDFNNACYRLQKVDINKYEISKVAAYEFGKVLRTAYRIKDKILKDCRLAFFLSSRSLIIGLDDAFDQAQKDTLAKYNQTAIVVELDLKEVRYFIGENADKSLKYIGEKLYQLLNLALRDSLQKNNLNTSKTLLLHFRDHFNEKLKEIRDQNQDDLEEFSQKMHDLGGVFNLRKIAGLNDKHNRYYVQKTNNGYIFVDIKDNELIVAFAYDNKTDYVIYYPLHTSEMIMKYFELQLQTYA